MKRRIDALALGREDRDEISQHAGGALVGHVNRHDKGRAARRRGASVTKQDQRQGNGSEEVMERTAAVA